MADFDRLMAEAKRRNIRVLLDFVVNHSSDQHPWFIESASSRTNPKADWYMWHDGKGPDLAPHPITGRLHSEAPPGNGPRAQTVLLSLLL